MRHEADEVQGDKYRYLEHYRSPEVLHEGHNVRRPQGRPKTPMSATQQKVAAAFHEVKADEPAVVAKTRRKQGAKAAQRQKTAIALSKARAQGAYVPKKG